jgi:hypothetical protein
MERRLWFSPTRNCARKPPFSARDTQALRDIGRSIRSFALDFWGTVADTRESAVQLAPVLALGRGGRLTSGCIRANFWMYFGCMLLRRSARQRSGGKLGDKRGEARGGGASCRVSADGESVELFQATLLLSFKPCLVALAASVYRH